MMAGPRFEYPWHNRVIFTAEAFGRPKWVFGATLDVKQEWIVNFEENVGDKSPEIPAASTSSCEFQQQTAFTEVSIS